MKQLQRRRFLYCVGGVGAVAGIFSTRRQYPYLDWKSPVGAGVNEPIDELQTVTRGMWALGSTVSMTVLHRSAAHASRAIDAAFAELKLIEELMSIYRPNSQLSRLNRDRVIHDPHPYLCDVLAAAQNMSERTHGAFDITIQPLWELFAGARRSGELPSDADVKAARDLVDWRRVETSSDRVRLLGKGTKITLNGIAQGFAADRVAATLSKHGIHIAMIDTGEIGALGAKPHTDGWKVGIQHPREEDAYISIAKLAGRCLATSGDYATTFSAEHQHHHLFDPLTGYSPQELSSVSIVADSALSADAMSTSVFVMGLADGTALIQQTQNAGAAFVTKDGRTMVTDGFPLA